MSAASSAVAAAAGAERHGIHLEPQNSATAAGQGLVRPSRRKLPEERQAITHKFSIAGHEGYITVGMFEDGAPGEVFITWPKKALRSPA